MGPETDRVICIGGATVDRKYRGNEPLRLKTSNPVASARSFGGVARNVAENVARLGKPVSLVSAVGDDENGRAVLGHLARLNIGTRHVAILHDHATAEYVAILQPDGDLVVGLADMAILDSLTPSVLHDAWPDIGESWIFADCNLPAQSLHELIDLARRHDAMLAVDAVSSPKAMRLPHELNGIGLLFLNLDEAQAFLGKPGIAPNEAARALLDRGAKRVILTLGGNGLVAADRSGTTGLSATAVQVVDATGAGDALIAATLVAMLNGRSFVEAARLGTMAAALTLESPASVRPDLSFSWLESMASRDVQRTFAPEAL